MTHDDDLRKLNKAIDEAMEHLRTQLNTMGKAALPISIASILVTAGLSAWLKMLLLWVPTAFILWLLLFIITLCSWVRIIFRIRRAVAANTTHVPVRQLRIG